jgi:hypothetical protein
MTKNCRQLCACLILASGPGLAEDGAELFRNNCSTRRRSGSPAQASLPETLRRLPPQAMEDK